MDPYLGQLSVFAFPFAPRSWAFCDGSLIPINQSTALFSLIGVTFGGDGRTNFGLPKLNGASPCSTGQGPGLTNRTLGQTFGTAAVALDQTTMPAHNHIANAVQPSRTIARTEIPTVASGLTTASSGGLYSNGAANAVMAATAVSPTGGNAPHNNLQPYLAMNYGIAMQGVFPSFN